MGEWTFAELSAARAVKYGDGYRTRRSELGLPGYRILRVADVEDWSIRIEGSDYVSEQFAPAIGSKLSEPDDVLLSTKGTVGRVAVFPAGAEQVAYSPQLCFFRVIDKKRLSPRYLAYWFKSPQAVRQINDRSRSTDMAPYLSLRDIGTMRLVLPSPDTQRAIAEVLGALDDKIAANERVLGLSRDLARSRYRQASASGARTCRLEDVSAFHNRRRVPLSSNERDERVGSVPYYGAAGRLDSVDEAIFDERIVLVGEDGTVIREDGRPVIQYVWGPAWVNNHAHVLTGTSISTEALRWALDLTNVTHLVTGAVQPKISMANLKSLEIAVPTDTSQMERDIADLAATERGLTEESRVLARTRDELLPLLMSGKVTVMDAEATVAEL